MKKEDFNQRCEITFGHGRLLCKKAQKWVAEKRELTREAPKINPATYKAADPDPLIRANREFIFGIL